jgi:phosphate transport system substrate-binding protein
MRISALLLAILLAACSPSTATPARDPLAGLYKIGGGDASIDIVKALTDAYAAKHAGVKFDLDTSLGSDAAVKLAGDGTLDLGMASRELTSAEQLLVDRHPIGVAGTAVAVNAQNLVRTLSSEDVANIYAGRAANWTVFGGERMNIVALVREKGSSARTTFENVIFDGKPSYSVNVLEISGGDQMRQSISGQRAAVGIIGVTGKDPEVAGIRIVGIDGVMPTKATLTDGTYKLRRPLYLLTPKSGSVKPAVTSFLEFVNGPDGRKILDRF